MATATNLKADVKDLGLAAKGKKRIEWASRSMPVLELIRKRFLKEKPLEGLKVSACLHVTTETANLMTTLRDGGADAVICASNPSEHTRRRGCLAGAGLRYSCICHQR